MNIKDYFKPENADLKHRREHLSPSGRYRLVITTYATKPGSWGVTQGIVYEVGDDAPIAEVQRNYSSFPFLFIENHQSVHPYLVCGADYQGQSVIELDTGRRRELLPEEAKKGHGFCWSSYVYEPSAQMLVVEGCYWAAPYEFRFYDFSDPMNGWPLIELPGDSIDHDVRPPTFNPDGTITCFQSEEVEDDSDDEEDPPPGPIVATRTFRREGLKLLIVNEWVSEKELARRKANEEASARYEAWLTNFRASDPLYLAMRAKLKDTVFKDADAYDGVGQTYSNWCPDFKVVERRMCRRIIKANPYSIDLEWGTDTGPVKLVIFKDGKHLEDKFWAEHSAASIEAAFDYSKKLVEGAT